LHIYRVYAIVLINIGQAKYFVASESKVNRKNDLLKYLVGFAHDLNARSRSEEASFVKSQSEDPHKGDELADEDRSEAPPQSKPTSLQVAEEDEREGGEARVHVEGPAPLQPVAHREEGEGGDEAQEFIVEQLEYSEGEEHNTTRLGDAIRVKCCATGKYMRVHKDGRCDGNGDYSDTETQMNVDMGGQTVATNAVVTLKSAVTGGHMFGDSEGNLSAFPGGDTWKYWQLTKKEDAPAGAGDVADADADGEGGLASTDNDGSMSMTPTIAQVQNSSSHARS